MSSEGTSLTPSSVPSSDNAPAHPSRQDRFRHEHHCKSKRLKSTNHGQTTRCFLKQWLRRCHRTQHVCSIGTGNIGCSIGTSGIADARKVIWGKTSDNMSDKLGTNSWRGRTGAATSCDGVIIFCDPGFKVLLDLVSAAGDLKFG